MARSFVAGSFQNIQVEQAVVTGPPYTMATWFSVPDVTGIYALMWLGDKDVGDVMHRMNTRGDQGGDPIDLRRQDGGGGDSVYSTTGYTANTWYHGCATATADDDVAIYLNGGGKATSAVTRTAPGWDRTAMGVAADSSPSSYMTGALAESAMWNAVLTNAEVAILAAGFSPLFVRPESLVAYWPLIRTDNDRAGGYHMTPINTPSWADHTPIIYPAPPIFYSIPSAGAGPTYTLTAEYGAFTQTGQASGTLFNRLIEALQGNYTLTGQDTGLLLGRLLAADQGSFTLTGQDTALLLGRLLTAAQGSFTLNGQTTGLLFNRLLSAAQGSFTLSGQSAGLLFGRLLSAAQGSFTLTGQAVDLVYSGGAFDYTLVADQGSFSLTGEDSSLLLSRLLTAAQGSFVLTGQASDLLQGRRLSAGQGAFVLTGQDASLLLNRVLSASQGSFTLTGIAVALTFSGEVVGAVVELQDSTAYFVVLTNAGAYVVVLSDSAAHDAVLQDALP